MASGAGGAAGAIAWGGAPQRGAQPQEYEVRDLISPGGASDLKKWWLKTDMSSTRLSLYYHLVFSTHDRLRWIDNSWQERLAQYIGGIVRDIEGIAIEIGGDSDHSCDNGIEFDKKYLW